MEKTVDYVVKAWFSWSNEEVEVGFFNHFNGAKHCAQLVKMSNKTKNVRIVKVTKEEVEWE